jgi:6-phosphogluconolactonase
VFRGAWFAPGVPAALRGTPGTSCTLGRFRVDTASGKLTYLGSTSTEKQLRGFNIDPTGRFAVVSGEQSDTISSYVIDAETGALSVPDSP